MMTTDQGSPKADANKPLIVGNGASTLLQDFRFIEKVALENVPHFDQGGGSPRGSSTPGGGAGRCGGA
jgi:catalase